MTLESSLDKLLEANGIFGQTSEELVHQNYQSGKITTEQDHSQSMSVSDYLVAFTTQSHSFCVGCVDMVDSTKITASMPKDKITKYYGTFLNSMARIVGMYDGKVIKNIGDCLLYYFPSSKDAHDLDGVAKSLDCGIEMIKAQKIISQKLVSNGLSNLRYRVSADYGNVMIMNANNSTEIDMIGSPVNMCSKINHSAKSNEFVIGGDFYEVVKRLHRYNFKQVHEYDVGFKSGYPVYKVESEQYSHEA